MPRQTGVQDLLSTELLIELCANFLPRIPEVRRQHWSKEGLHKKYINI